MMAVAVPDTGGRRGEELGDGPTCRDEPSDGPDSRAETTGELLRTDADRQGSEGGRQGADERRRSTGGSGRYAAVYHSEPGSRRPGGAGRRGGRPGARGRPRWSAGRVL